MRRKNTAIAILGMLVILACKTVQINVQVNIGMTSTVAADVGKQTMIPPAISQTPNFAVVSPTGTSTSSPEPMPRLVPGQPIELTGMNMFGSTTGWGFEPSGHILYTLDGGRTWNDVTPPQSSYYTASTFYAEDPNIAWAVASQPGQVRSWQTSDAGRSWQPGEPIDLGKIDAGKCGPLHLGQALIPQVWFVDSIRGWMVASADAVEHGYIVSMLFSTTDGGAHWDLKYLATRDCSTSNGPAGLWSVLFRIPGEG